MQLLQQLQSTKGNSPIQSAAIIAEFADCMLHIESGMDPIRLFSSSKSSSEMIFRKSKQMKSISQKDNELTTYLILSTNLTVKILFHSSSYDPTLSFLS